jgi:TolB-like protein/Tfp pilus assembly protein PilF
VHRDLKPANILVTAEGGVKLLDFGIAKQSPLTDPSGTGVETADFTHVGLIMGTPAYMSPEQAEGRAADARSDIFSFGAIFYEMLAGKRAFPGASMASTLGAVLHRAPDALTATPQLTSIVFRCLAKVPKERFQTATELRLALEQAMTDGGSTRVSVFRRRGRILALGALSLLIAAGVGTHAWQRARAEAIRAIAVLPLDIQSSDPDADYIADGIAESVNNRLSRVPDLRVIPNSVAAQYKGQAAEFQKIGATLGIDAVLSGRATQHGDELTVSMELNDVHRGTQLWGQRYTRKVADLLAMQNDISREVSQRLRSQLSEHDQQRMEMGSTANAEAYQLYLKGQYHTAKFTRAGFAKGIEYLNQAIALDPGYAEAYSALAYNYINQDDWFLAPADSAPLARTAALKALSLQETDSEAHVVLGIENHWYEWDWSAAEREFRRGIELGPDNGDAHGYYSWFLPTLGRNDEAVEQARLMTRAFPLSTGANANLGSVLVFTHRWDEAIAQCQAAIDLNPNYWFDYYFLARAYEQKGQLDQAIDAFQKGLKLEGNTELWGGLGHAYGLAGRREEAAEVLRQLDEIAKVRYVAPYNVALVHLGLGDRDAAFAWLERAFEAKSYLLAVYLNTDARLKDLYADARYRSLHSRMHLPVLK